jgi:hypothetical protein
MTPFMMLSVKNAATWLNSLRMILAGTVLAVRKKSLMTGRITAATGGVRRMMNLITTFAISTVKESVGSNFKSLYYNIKVCHP